MRFTRPALIPPRIWATANTVQPEVTTPGVPLAGVQAVEPEAVEAGLTLETIKEIIMVLVRKFPVQPTVYIRKPSARFLYQVAKKST